MRTLTELRDEAIHNAINSEEPHRSFWIDKVEQLDKLIGDDHSPLDLAATAS